MHSDTVILRDPSSRVPEGAMKDHYYIPLLSVASENPLAALFRTARARYIPFCSETQASSEGSLTSCHYNELLDRTPQVFHNQLPCQTFAETLQPHGQIIAPADFNPGRLE